MSGINVYNNVIFLTIWLATNEDVHDGYFCALMSTCIGHILHTEVVSTHTHRKRERER